MEVVLRADRPDLVVESAGTIATEGEAWHPFAVEALARSGYDGANGTAQKLTAAMVKRARLLLVAEGAHRSSAIQLDASAEDRTFTLLEAARLIGDDAPAETVEELRERLTTALYSQRVEHNDDLADPLMGELHDFETTLDLVRTSLHVILGSRPAD